MKAVKAFFKAIVGLFAGSNSPAQQLLGVVLGFIPAADPLITLVVTLRPGLEDDIAYYAIKEMFPKFFDPDLTDEERKLYFLGVAAELLRLKFPVLTTTMARIAVQVAYALRVAAEWLEDRNAKE